MLREIGGYMKDLAKGCLGDMGSRKGSRGDSSLAAAILAEKRPAASVTRTCLMRHPMK